MSQNVLAIATLSLAKRLCRKHKPKMQRTTVCLETLTIDREYVCIQCHRRGRMQLPAGSTGYGPMRWE